MAGNAVEKLSTVIHSNSQKEEAKKKEERPTMTFFLSSNDNGKDQLKSGQPWSEELGAPQVSTYYVPLIMRGCIEIFWPLSNKLGSGPFSFGMWKRHFLGISLGHTS